MLSKRFGENLFDEMFDDPFELMPMFSRHNPLYGSKGFDEDRRPGKG